MTDSRRTQRVRDVLARSVQLATGLTGAAPRPGQLALVDAMTAAADPPGGHMAGIAPTGVGKALDVDTLVPTPSGFTTMGQLTPGDRVFDENGSVVSVVKAHEIVNNRDCYEVKFSDGSTVTADGEHLWSTTTRAERGTMSSAKSSATRYPAAAERNLARHADLKRAAGSAKTTMEILATLTGQGGGKNHAVPVAGALDLPEADLLIDPYVLGVWLGDGSSNGAQLTSADPFIVEEIGRRGYFTRMLRGKFLYSIRLNEGDTHASRPTLRGHLRTIGVLNDKHIPPVYLRASASQRLELLQGLMDTDGTVSQNGQCEFAVVSERLANDVFDLVASLGIKPTMHSGAAVLTEEDPDNPGKKRRRAVGTRYRVHFTTSQKVALLPRKRDLINDETRLTQDNRYIVAVTPVAPRPVRCIEVSSDSRLFLVGREMIPTHNSLSALSEAAVGAIDYGERWLISTHSVGLQTQYVEKDGPPIVQAAREVLGKGVDIAVLKGWAQYGCAMKTRETAAQMGVGIRSAESGVIGVAKRVQKMRLAKTVVVDGVELDSVRMQPLVAWVLAQHEDADLPGDRGDYTGMASDQEWAAVSVSTSECLGELACPMAAICKPLAARRKAAEADIVITNHSMLAVQAATGTPVVIGSNKLGVFHGIVVDEAHALPGIVRAQGQALINGGRVAAIARRVRVATDDSQPHIRRWLQEGQHLVDQVNKEIAGGIPDGAGTTIKVPEDKDPLELTGDALTHWLRRGSKLVTESGRGHTSMSKIIAGRRVIGDIDQLVHNIESVREHWVGTARWWEPAKPQPPGESVARRAWASVQSAPVLVGKMIERNLWNDITPDTEEDEEKLRPLSVACMSATLPEGFQREVGLSAIPVRFQSPFDGAYANSMLYIPRAVDEPDVAALTTTTSWGKAKFGTHKHAAWAVEQMVQLVAANHGSALVLSSTTSSGKLYAQRLRGDARGRWRVYSQWDGEPASAVTSHWRNDKSSVLVGTRSLMTGVDAPGETNTLVIVDRAPRSASNPVDDARVETLTAAFGGDKWAADRLVYVSDAALLLDQAVGRLIRSVSDTGLAAVLDPRMLNAGPFKYQTQVRRAYLRALERFTVKTSSLNDALSFLHGRPRY